jgi:glycine/D-amino acid oxidase-like deaminating enzyme
MVGLDMPVRPLRGQILVTERLRPLLNHPTHVMRQTQEGSVMLGDSQEDVGFDTSTSTQVIGEITARNIRVLPALADARIVRIWGGRCGSCRPTGCRSTTSPNATQGPSPPPAIAA